MPVFTENTEVNYYPPVPNEYGDNLVQTTYEILKYAGTLGIPIDITFNLLKPTFLGNLVNRLIRKLENEPDEEIVITAKTSQTSEGRTALGVFFCSIDERQGNILKKIGAIEFESGTHDVYSATGHYHVIG